MVYHCKVCGFTGPDSSRYIHNARAESIHHALRTLNTEIRQAKREGKKYIILGNKKYKI